MSSADAELNALAVATATAMHVRMIVMWFLHGSTDHPVTLPVFCDNSTSVIITTNDKHASY